VTDTSQHIKDLQLKLWMQKTPGERLYQFLMDNDAMLNALRKVKKEMDIPPGDLDFVNEYLKNKQNPGEKTGE
jgi:hypothetical protein